MSSWTYVCPPVRKVVAVESVSVDGIRDGVDLCSWDGRLGRVADGAGNLRGDGYWPNLPGGTPMVDYINSMPKSQVDALDEQAVNSGICLDAEGAVWYGDVPNKRCMRVREGSEVLQAIALDRGCFACMLGGVASKTTQTSASAGVERQQVTRHWPRDTPR
jgi:hypothetical protein